MRPGTDMEKVRQVARTLLHLDIHPTSLSPMVVSHPFTNSGFVGLRDEDGNVSIGALLDDPEALSRWWQQVGRSIDRAESPWEIAMQINTPYLLTFIKYTRPYLSEPDLGHLLAAAWTIDETSNQDPNLNRRSLAGLFRSVLRLPEVSDGCERTAAVPGAGRSGDSLSGPHISQRQKHPGSVLDPGPGHGGVVRPPLQGGWDRVCGPDRKAAYLGPLPGVEQVGGGGGPPASGAGHGRFGTTIRDAYGMTGRSRRSGYFCFEEGDMPNVHSPRPQKAARQPLRLPDSGDLATPQPVQGLPLSPTRPDLLAPGWDLPADRRPKTISERMNPPCSISWDRLFVCIAHTRTAIGRTSGRLPAGRVRPL